MNPSIGPNKLKFIIFNFPRIFLNFAHFIENQDIFYVSGHSPLDLVMTSGNLVSDITYTIFFMHSCESNETSLTTILKLDSSELISNFWTILSFSSLITPTISNVTFSFLSKISALSLLYQGDSGFPTVFAVNFGLPQAKIVVTVVYSNWDGSSGDFFLLGGVTQLCAVGRTS